MLATAYSLGLTLARLPRRTAFQSGVIEDASKVRPIAIEDLLGRSQTVLDRAAMGALIEGKRVLVTSAGGTIGAELTRQIASYGPAHLVLLDNAEFNLYEIDGQIAERYPGLSRKATLGDIREVVRIDQILAREKPDILFHAAAFKHVPMVEANPNEGVLTNVIGTRNLADACRAAGIKTMVMISTDKAVNPTSVMGATKRIAELYCQALGAAAGDTRFVLLAALLMGAGIMVAPPLIAVEWFDAGVFVVWIFICAYLAAGAVVFYLRFRGGKWKSMRVIEAAAPVNIEVPRMTETEAGI